jgi:hypothetical protein
MFCELFATKYIFRGRPSIFHPSYLPLPSVHQEPPSFRQPPLSLSTINMNKFFKKVKDQCGDSALAWTLVTIVVFFVVVFVIVAVI